MIDAIFVRMWATGEQTSVTCAWTGEKGLRGRNCVLIVAILDPTHATSVAIAETFVEMSVTDVATVGTIDAIDAKRDETSQLVAVAEGRKAALQQHRRGRRF